MSESIIIEPSDLYTVLRIFYENPSQYTQAEQRAANRLNVVLRTTGWGYDPRKNDR